MCLFIQILSGLLLAFRYSPDVILAFDRVQMIINESFYGFIIRNIHANIASIFFFLMYVHIGRGIYFKSYIFKST